jgi:hypothetical protein
MADQNRLGPGRSTSEAALDEVRREVARRNQEAHTTEGELRSAGENQRLEGRKKWELESIRRVRRASPKLRE